MSFHVILKRPRDNRDEQGEIRLGLSEDDITQIQRSRLNRVKCQQWVLISHPFPYLSTALVLAGSSVHSGYPIVISYCITREE